MPARAATLAAYGSRRPAGGPLALVLGVHLLAAWWWLTTSATMPALPGALAPLRELFLMPARPAAPPIPADPPPAPPPTPVRTPARPAPQAALTAPTPAMAEDAPATDSAVATEPTIPPSSGAPAESMATRALRAAGAADHALRGGKLDKLAPADTAWTRFADGIAAASKQSTRTQHSDSYTAPDGTVIYRFRVAGKVYCRTGGGVRPRIGGAEGGGATQFDVAGGGGTAGTIACPASAEFKRD